MATLIVSVDVEEDMPDGRVLAQTTLRSLESLGALQAVFERLGVRPTWLCSYPVAVRAEAAPLLTWAQAGKGEIGALLHPWVTPPFEGHENRLEGQSPHRLSVTSAYAKVGALTAAVAEFAGQAPRAIRAAGFGLGGTLLQAIERHGYRVDASVTPGLDLRGQGGVDHRRAPSGPYFPHRQFVDQRGTSSVLEVPLSVGCEPWLAGATRDGAGDPRVSSFTERLLARVAPGRAHLLASSEPSVDRLCRLADGLMHGDVPCLHLYLRTSDLLGVSGTDGGAPQGAPQGVLERIERFLAYAVHTLGASPKTLSEFAESWAGGGD